MSGPEIAPGETTREPDTLRACSHSAHDRADIPKPAAIHRENQELPHGLNNEPSTRTQTANPIWGSHSHGFSLTHLPVPRKGQRERHLTSPTAHRYISLQNEDKIKEQMNTDALWVNHAI